MKKIPEIPNTRKKEIEKPVYIFIIIIIIWLIILTVEVFK